VARAAEIRVYVTALRQRAVTLGEGERERIEAWCSWAQSWADRTDPTRYPAELVVGLDDERDGRGW
jgi:hypothetical protein